MDKSTFTQEAVYAILFFIVILVKVIFEESWSITPAVNLAEVLSVIVILIIFISLEFYILNAAAYVDTVLLKNYIFCSKIFSL